MYNAKQKETNKRCRQRKIGIDIPLRKPGPMTVKGYVAKMKFLCAGCNTEFIGMQRPESDSKYTLKRYCTKACFNKRIKGEGNPNYKGNKPCRGCGVHIMGAQRSFCSRDCESSHYKKCAEIRAPQNKLNRNMRRAVVRFLAIGVKANRSWRSLTGFTSSELMDHLQSKFTEDMSWANYGSYWHLDHIKPVAAFVFSNPEDQEFKDCWALSNLQPLRAIDNFKKGSKYNGKRIYRCR